MPIHNHFFSRARIPRHTNRKSQLQDIQEFYGLSVQDGVHAHRAHHEEPVRHVEDLVNDVKREQEAHESLEREFDGTEKAL